MVPIWTLSNPLQYLTSPKKSRREGAFLDSTTYASNGLENWLSLICNNIKLSCKDHKIKIYNAIIPLNVRYYYIVCCLCSRQPVFKRERNPQQGISRIILNDYQISYQDLLNTRHHPTLFVDPVWKPLLQKCWNAWIASTPQAKDQERAPCAGCP